MKTRKKLSATKKTSHSKVKNVETEEFMENDAVILPEDDDFDFSNLDLDDDINLELDVDELDDDDFDSDDDELDDDDIDSDDDELNDDDFDSDDDELDDDDFDSDDDELDDDDIDSDDDELDDDDFDSDDDELDDDDFDSDDDELDDDDFDSDDDIFAHTVELENDPFAFVVELRQATLPSATNMLMYVKEIDYKIVPAEESKYGKEYKTFTIVGEVKHPVTKDLVKIKETGTTKNASFVQKVKAINNGTLPQSLSEIVGKKAIVTITHNTDELGNVWDNIDTVVPYNPSSKKKAK